MLLRSALGLATVLSVTPALTAGPHVTTVQPFSTTAPVTAVPGQPSNPTVDIDGPPASFQPGSISAPEIAQGSTCSVTNYSFMLSNMTHRPRTVTLGGHQVVELHAKQSTVFCAADTDGESFTLTFRLSGHAQARLVVNFSAAPSAP